MHLWQLDIVGGVPLADGQRCKLVTQLLDQLDHRMPPDPEFLDGRAGIALALLSTGSGPIQPLPWDACLALA